MKPNLIVMGASAGGIAALGTVLRDLPENLRASVLVVQHTSQGPGRLAHVLGRQTSLPVLHPGDGEIVKNGHVYVAPPDLHMILEKRKLRLVRGPRENRHRPAIDVLFRSAALHHGPRVIGVILSGALDDGTSGLQSVKNCGGLAVVQEPGSAEFPFMPESAIRHVRVDHVLPLRQIAQMLGKLTQTTMKTNGKRSRHEALETASAAGKVHDRESMDGMGKRSSLICPTCKGALWELEDRQLLRFRCHTGHGFTAESLLTDQELEIELALSHALRALEDRANLAKRLALRAKERKQEHNVALYQADMADAERHAEVVRKTLLNLVPSQHLG